MTRRGKLILAATLLLAATGAVIAVVKSKNKKKIKYINDVLDGTTKDVNDPAANAQKNIPESEYAKLPDGKFPLRVGDKSKKVYALQKMVNKNYGTNLDLDGKFGQGLYSILCDKYWSLCGSSMGYYGRTVSQSDYESIAKAK